MSFRRGETVIYTASDNGVATNLTDGHEYTVQADTYGRWVPIIGDDNKDCHVNAKCIKSKSAGKLPNPHGLRPQPSKAQATAAITAVLKGDDVDDYEESKANASVTSSGLFDKGDVLIYRDGTATLEPRTVARCTATCVWFNETYSMPFNPIEFTKEGYDE